LSRTSYLHRFVIAAPNKNKTRTECFYVRKVNKTGEDRISTPIEDVKKMFERYMKFNHEGKKHTWDDNDYSTFKELGYEVQKINMCKSCKRRAKGGKEKCCPNYSVANRVKKVMVMDLEIVRETLDPPSYQLEAVKNLLMRD